MDVRCQTILRGFIYYKDKKIIYANTAKIPLQIPSLQAYIEYLCIQLIRIFKKSHNFGGRSFIIEYI